MFKKNKNKKEGKNKMLGINEYQKEAHKTACYLGLKDKDYSYPVMGLAEEAGEVCGKFAKAIRDEEGTISPDRKEAIKKELGDVCWFVAEISTILDLELEDVMQTNLMKLASRKEHGVLHGSGDDR